MSRVRPAALKMSGIMFATPRPTSPNPTIAAIGSVTTIARSRPALASAPDVRSRRVEPNRCATRSPPKRPAAIASENAAKPAAATLWAAARTSIRYTALQSPIAPSASSAHNARIPRPRSPRVGLTKTGSSAADGVIAISRRPAAPTARLPASAAPTACDLAPTPCARITPLKSCAGEASETEQRVEGRHDRPPPPRLDLDGLNVHRHVERGVERAEQHERARERERCRRQHRTGQRQAEAERGAHADRAAPEPAHERAR